MTFKKITIIGSGVLGSQIAFQSAFFGFDVTIYSSSATSVEKAKGRLTALTPIYGQYFKDEVRANEALASFTFETDLATAVQQADLIIESIPERLDVKQELYAKLATVAPANTIFATNSSTLLPSQIAGFTGRPDKFIALHFANSIWQKNTAEIMGHAETSIETTEQVTSFARSINMIPFVLKKEQPGYILNSLLVPFLTSAMSLWVQDIADHETIDKNWMISTGAPVGPFGILDIVGMETPFNLMQASEQPGAQLIAAKIKADMMEQGKMGVATGQGFYTYPNPAYRKEDFLTFN